jgi:hypothetical protein
MRHVAHSLPVEQFHARRKFPAISEFPVSHFCAVIRPLFWAKTVSQRGDSIPFSPATVTQVCVTCALTGRQPGPRWPPIFSGSPIFGRVRVKS